MPEQVLVGIDIGTSGIRVEVYDVNGSLVAYGKSSLREQSTEAWLEALKAATPRYLRECHCEKHVTVDGTSGTFLLVNSKGEPVSRPYMYYESDIPSYELVRARLSDDIAKKALVNAESPIVKLFGLKNRDSTVWSSASWVMPQATWVSYKICGQPPSDEVVTDYSNALKFGLDIMSSPPVYIREVYDYLNLDVAKLPKLSPSGALLCQASGSLADELGLKGAMVYNGMTDGNSSALAGGALETGDVSVYGGSTSVVKAVSDRVVPHPSLYYHIHPISGYLAGGATGFTGAFLSWIAEKVMGVSVEEAIRYAERSSGPYPIFFPPADRSPFYVSNVLASLINISPNLSEPRESAIGRVTAGIAAGIASVERLFLDLFESLLGLRITAVGVTGGTSKSPYLNRVRAEVYNRIVLVYGDSVAKGALVPVLLSNSFKMTISKVKAYFLRPIEQYNPKGELREIRSLTDGYANVWPKLVDVISRLK